MTEVVVVDSGVANLASVERVFRRLGCDVRVSTDRRRVTSAAFVVLPGVGSYAAGMEALRAAGLVECLRGRLAEDRPLLAVCLGFQLLARGSDEAPGVDGVGAFDGVFERLPRSAGVPHLGWSGVLPPSSPGPLTAGCAAYAHSFALLRAPGGWGAAWSEHGAPFVAAVWRGRTLATQFHPELSSGWGRDLVGRWLEGRPADAGSAVTAGLRRRVVACLDVRDGRVVKGVRFQGLRDAGDPAERAALYAAQGADEITLLDVGASPEGRAHQVATVAAVRARIDVPLTVGGGVREVDDARRLLGAGADKVSVNTAALARPVLVARLAGEFGSQSVVVAIDARRAGDSWCALSSGGRADGGRDAVTWAREAADVGAGEILLTSWDRDGTREGCDLSLIGAVRRRVGVPIVASGGVGSRDDVYAAFAAGADAVLAASLFHDGDDSVADLKVDLAARGVVVRP